jgi:hypothetical protein
MFKPLECPVPCPSLSSTYDSERSHTELAAPSKWARLLIETMSTPIHEIRDRIVAGRSGSKQLEPEADTPQTSELPQTLLACPSSVSYKIDHSFQAGERSGIIQWAVNAFNSTPLAQLKEDDPCVVVNVFCYPCSMCNAGTAGTAKPCLNLEHTSYEFRTEKGQCQYPAAPHKHVRVWHDRVLYASLRSV